MMPDVRIVPCESYKPTVCDKATAQLLDGFLDWAKPGMTVVIKANLVSMAKPEKAVTTHPELMCSVVRLLKEKQCRVIIGDSPGGLYNSVYVGRVYSAAGLKLCEAAGAELNSDFSQKETEFPDGKVCRSFTYTSYLDNADAIIDFCKLKTHGMMGMSAAAKNMFGVIPGTFKPEYHFRYPKHDEFADMIVDLDEYFKPTLSICDAVTAMEGNGPTKGTPRHIGAVLASFSPHKLDLVCAKLIGLKKDDVPTIEAAYRRGLCPASASELYIDGDADAFAVNDFNNIADRDSMLFDGNIMGGKLLGAFAEKCLRSKPKLKESLCVGCNECGNICPANAITMKNKKAVIDRKKCIRCFCCQEFCPAGAMRTHRPLIARIVNR